MSEQVQLDPMTEAEYAAFVAVSVPEYGEEKVAAGQWAEADAAELAAKSFASLLPEGRATAGHHLFTARDADGTDVGVVWFAVEARASGDVAYLYQIRLRPECRGRGLGEAVMRALEAEVMARGLAGIGLHVFGHNARARALYDKLGYRATSVIMFKPL